MEHLPPALVRPVDRLVRDDLFTSIHIEKHEIEARDTKLGPEEITRDIPNVGEESLKDLNEEGVVFIASTDTGGELARKMVEDIVKAIE